MPTRIDIKAAIKTINVIEYTSNDTYIAPHNLAYARVICIGAGGGGGSGRIDTLLALAGGAAGGGGGALARREFLKSELNPIGESIIIGIGGTGGAARQDDTTPTAGQLGASGTDTIFGANLVLAKGGGGGFGGNTGTGGGGSAGSLLNSIPDKFLLTIAGIAGSGAITTAGTGTPANTLSGSTTGCNGGAGGAAKPAAGTAHNGGSGGRGFDITNTQTPVVPGGVAPGGHGTNGADNAILQIIGEYPVIPSNTKGIGLAGSGGASSNVDGIPGGNGGHGGLYGAGGSGGGAGLVGAVPNGSGAGGNGAQGLCIIIEYLF